MVDDTFLKITLGALLHDIGKFKQRADLEEDRGKSHVEIGYTWLSAHYGEGAIAAGARNHHGNEPETWETNIGLIYYEADNCSASERNTNFDPKVDAGKSWFREIRLANVFGQIRNPNAKEGEKASLPSRTYWPITSLGTWVEPDNDETRKNNAIDYRNLWEKFEKEFLVLKEAGIHDSNTDAILHLLEKYTSFIPSITLKVYADGEANTYRKHPDVSLFDHLKVTAAVASCLYQYCRTVYADRWERGEILKAEITSANPENQPFMLVGGDISGVQKFIYTISSKGALKSLKGRSFFLELLTEHTIDRLLEEMTLTRCNVIFSGGGHFYLLAPNTERANDAVRKVRTEVNDYLLKSFNGALQQFIEATSFGKDAFKDATNVWGNLSAVLEDAKRKKWSEYLDRILELPQMPHSDALKENCGVCGREDQPLAPLSTDTDTNACPFCREQYLLGANLRDVCRRGEYPVIYRWDLEPDDTVQAKCIKIGNRYYQPAAGVFGKGKAELNQMATAVYHLNDWDISHYTHPASRPMLAGNYLSDAQDLEEMTKGGFGIERIAVLRMDVDNLGRIFSSCVEERRFSRMASLSRQFSLFFKYHVNGILDVNRQDGYVSLTKTDSARRRTAETLRERRLAVVYSGGDDLFLIGHWLDITEAAFDIRNAFQRFTGNQFITVSGGITLGYPHEPAYRLADLAGEAEDVAKGNGRNSITIFGHHTFKWYEAVNIQEMIGSSLIPLLSTNKDKLLLPEHSFSKGFLYRALGLVRSVKKEKAWILPKFAYLCGRNGPDKTWLSKDERRAAAWQQLHQALFAAPEAGASGRHYKQVEVAILWTLMMMRKGGEK